MALKISYGAGALGTNPLFFFVANNVAVVLLNLLPSPSPSTRI